MGTFYGTGEIIELEERSEHDSSFTKPGKKFNVEDEINRLFESIRVSRPSDLPQLRKKSMKRPMRIEPFQSLGIRVSEPVSLKQALRGLSISQASEMAATKRLSKSSGFSRVPDQPGPVKKLTKANENTGPGISEVGESQSQSQTRNLKLKLSSLSTRARKKLPVVNETLPGPVSSKPELVTEFKRRHNVIVKSDDKSRSREKGEFSQSSKSSIGRCSSSTSFSCESGLSAFRPHMSKDSKWEAVKHHGKTLSLTDFKLIKKIGGGDIGTVYLAELIGSRSNCLFALKILDNGLLDIKKKATRAQTEREILQMLDHPFLPTLFSQFTTDNYSCLVIEYCPGGDLHVLRQKQPNKCFSEQAARFYVAETLLALEYLHMLGIIYRDLKPENILVREDGHIMLTDFDLSLRCNPNPTLLNPLTAPSPTVDRPKPKPTEPRCIDPFLPCFSPRLQPDLAVITPMPQLVVEPTGARSNSFVGTHEYLAPEIVKGEGHGSPVDWWTFGVLLYELLYGATPFKGVTDDETLANVVSRDVEFPDCPMVSCRARDLVTGLLRKNPGNRLGSVNGAADIRRHPFFEGLNWALIRCAVPPEMPKVCEKEVKVFDLF